MSRSLRGWIVAPKESRTELESMGISLGKYDDSQAPHEVGTFLDCLVPEAAFAQLEHHWGRFIWGLAE
jgi:hypothetical protein